MEIDKMGLNDSCVKPDFENKKINKYATITHPLTEK